MKRRRALAWALVGLPSAAVGLFAAWLAYGFSLADRNFDVRRGSIEYYLLFGATIRNVPLIEPAGAPRFHFRGGDGPKPTETIVTYASKADAARLEAELARYFEARGYKRRENDNAPPADVFGDVPVWFEIVTKAEPDKTIRVFVSKFEL